LYLGTEEGKKRKKGRGKSLERREREGERNTSRYPGAKLGEKKKASQKLPVDLIKRMQDHALEKKGKEKTLQKKSVLKKTKGKKGGPGAGD